MGIEQRRPGNDETQESRKEQVRNMVSEGAEIVESPEDKMIRLRATEEQVEGARAEMEQEMEARQQQERGRAEAVGESINSMFEERERMLANPESGHGVDTREESREELIARRDGMVMQRDAIDAHLEKSAAEMKIEDAERLGRWNGTQESRKKSQKSELKATLALGGGLGAILLGAGAAGIATIAAPVALGFGATVALGGAARYGWQRLREKFKKNEVFGPGGKYDHFSPEEKAAFNKGTKERENTPNLKRRRGILERISHAIQ